jgi:CAAX protease family protein
LSSQTTAHHSVNHLEKILHFPLTRMVLAVLFVLIAVIIAQGIIGLLGKVGDLDSPILGLLSALIATLAICGAYYAYVHLVEHRAVVELSGPGAFSEFGIGALLGSGVFAVIILILWLLGYYKIEGFNPWVVLIPAIVANVPSGFIQEIIFRGVIFRITEESLGSWLALAISAILFGLVHILMDKATLVSTISIMLEAGVLLGAAYMLTHRLWLPIGIHIGWDMANDGIFGVGSAGISGTPLQGLFQAKLSGLVLLTGGVLGVEASLIAVAILLGVSIILLRMAVKRGHIASPFWKRRKNSIAMN